MNDKIKTIVNLNIFLVLFLMRCVLAEGGDAAVISKKAVVGKGCLSNERDFVFSGLDERGFQNKRNGSIRFSDSGYQFRDMGGAGYGRELEYENDYLVVWGGVTHFSRARLQVACPETGATVFDSGEVVWKDSVCRTKEAKSIFFLEGIPKKLKLPREICPPIFDK